MQKYFPDKKGYGLSQYNVEGEEYEIMGRKRLEE